MITVNGDPMPHSADLTIQKILEAKNFKFPLLVVHIDGKLVPRTAYQTTLVPDQADVQVIHLMSGG